MTTVTNETLMMIIAILGLAGGIFSAFSGIRERLARVETDIKHIARALGVKHREDEEG